MIASENYHPFIAVDLLGFERVTQESKDMGSIIKPYVEFCSKAFNALNMNKQNIFPEPIVQVFSDTILISAENHTQDFYDVDDYIKFMIKSLSKLIHDSVISLDTDYESDSEPSFQNSIKIVPIPIRAAFTLNKYYAAKQFPVFGGQITPFIVGKAVAKACAWEKKLDWFGASFDNETYEYMKNNKKIIVQELIANKLIVEYNVPTKGDSIITYAVNFYKKNSIDRLRTSLKKHEERNIGNKDVLAKCKGTMNFLEYCHKNDLAVIE